jgi:hypothetical protein
MITEITARDAGRTTLEITSRVKQKSLVFRSVFGFIIFLTPHFCNPYLTKVTNQLGTTLFVTPKVGRID